MLLATSISPRSSFGTAAWIACAILFAALIPYAIPDAYYRGLAIHAGVLAIFGLSMNIVYGYMGYISFGHAAFFGLGGYVAGLISVKFGLNFWAVALFALVPGVIFGACVGYASLRLAGAYFAVASLTLAEILRLTAINWMSVTRGPLGVVVPSPQIAPLQDLGLQLQHYHMSIVVVLLVGVIFGTRRLVDSPVGRAWFGVREQPALAEAVGIPTLRYRVLNVSLSGGIAALAGALLVPRTLVLSPDLFSTSYSAMALLIVVLGGRGTLIGPVIGGVLFAVLPELLRVVDEVRMAVFAVLLLIAVRVIPSGLAGVLGFVRPIQRPDVGQRVGLRQALPKVQLPQGEVLLSVRDISRRFGGMQALRQVSFDVKVGEVVGIIGPNGAGKTTCLSCVAGAIQPDSGDVEFNGQSIRGKEPHEVAVAGLVRTFQQTALFTNLSVLDNVLVASHLYEVKSVGSTVWSSIIRGSVFRKTEASRVERAISLLHLVGLSGSAGQSADDLSYGNKKLLSIAVALAASPRLLLLDEPAAGLNHAEAGKLTQVLTQLVEQGISIVIVDHNLKMMMSFCDRIVVLHHGEMLASGTPAAMVADPRVVSAYLGGTSA